MSDGKYGFKVNGLEFTTEKADPTALEILDIAKRGGAVSDNPAEYILKGEKAEYRGDERVDLAVDNVFITVPAGPTPTA